LDELDLLKVISEADGFKPENEAPVRLMMDFVKRFHSDLGAVFCSWPFSLPSSIARNLSRRRRGPSCSSSRETPASFLVSKFGDRFLGGRGEAKAQSEAGLLGKRTIG
jgi:hypothetical protein